MLELVNVSTKGRIEQVNLLLTQGQYWHLLGPNGSGKSSLMSILAGILSTDDGQVILNEQLLDSQALPLLARQRCFLQQQQISSFDIPLQQLLEFYTQQSRLPEELELCLNLNTLLSKPLSTLSGGQQQRFNIARCLMQVWPNIQAGRALILLDEPCQQLDINYQFQLLNLLGRFSACGNLVIVTSHDINQSYRHASHVALLKNNVIHAHGIAREVLSMDNLENVFEHRFIEISTVSDVLSAPELLHASEQAFMNSKGLEKTFVSATNQAPFP